MWDGGDNSEVGERGKHHDHHRYNESGNAGDSWGVVEGEQSERSGSPHEKESGGSVIETVLDFFRHGSDEDDVVDEDVGQDIDSVDVVVEKDNNNKENGDDDNSDDDIVNDNVNHPNDCDSRGSSDSGSDCSVDTEIDVAGDRSEIVGVSGEIQLSVDDSVNKEVSNQELFSLDSAVDADFVTNQFSNGDNNSEEALGNSEIEKEGDDFVNKDRDTNQGFSLDTAVDSGFLSNEFSNGNNGFDNALGNFETNENVADSLNKDLIHQEFSADSTVDSDFVSQEFSIDNNNSDEKFGKFGGITSSVGKGDTQDINEFDTEYLTKEEKNGGVVSYIHEIKSYSSGNGNDDDESSLEISAKDTQESLESSFKESYKRPSPVDFNASESSFVDNSEQPSNKPDSVPAPEKVLQSAPDKNLKKLEIVIDPGTDSLSPLPPEIFSPSDFNRALHSPRLLSPRPRSLGSVSDDGFLDFYDSHTSESSNHPAGIQQSASLHGRFAGSSEETIISRSDKFVKVYSDRPGGWELAPHTLIYPLSEDQWRREARRRKWHGKTTTHEDDVVSFVITVNRKSSNDDLLNADDHSTTLRHRTTAVADRNLPFTKTKETYVTFGSTPNIYNTDKITKLKMDGDKKNLVERSTDADNAPLIRRENATTMPLFGKKKKQAPEPDTSTKDGEAIKMENGTVDAVDGALESKEAKVENGVTEADSTAVTTEKEADEKTGTTFTPAITDDPKQEVKDEAGQQATGETTNPPTAPVKTEKSPLIGKPESQELNVKESKLRDHSPGFLCCSIL